MEAAVNTWLDQLCCLTMLVTMVVVAHKLFIRRDEEQVPNRHDPSQNMGALKRVWLAKGDVRIDPIPAYYYGTQTITKKSTLGGLGVINSLIVFGTADEPITLQLPISALRWASCTILKDNSLEDGTTTGLMLHVERGQWWDVHVFRVVAPSGIAGRLHAVLGVPSNMRDFDLGPAQVAVFEQDIYGQWNYQARGTAYLAPDRLLIDWMTALRFADLRTIAVGPARGLSQVTARLLRLSYRHDDGSLAGLGLQMDLAYAARWADAISSRTDIPVQVYDGRKGKDEKLAS